ncbi:MAG TPA: diphthine--ammonia ligase [Candidatus Omnitrophica bacterium]|nr:diphthine--ammonia ligase [Candidatus Omnitrophota bacterium]
MKEAAVLFTGGKDSCLALLKAKEKKIDVKYLLTIIPNSYDSYMFHKPSLSLLKAQAESLGISLITQKSKAEKEKEVKDLEKLFEKVMEEIDYILTGGVASKYQKERIEKAASKFGLKILNPLWGIKAEDIWGECLENDFEIILTKICCEGLSKEWLGKKITKKLFAELVKKSKTHGFSLEFEGGDAETAVLDMPLFKERLRISSKIISESTYRHFLVINKVKKEKKEKEMKE